MPRITLLTVGKLKNKSCKELVADYQERLSHYTPFDIQEVRDSAAVDPAQKQREECASLDQQIDWSDHVFLLDQRGKSLTSEQLARELNEEAKSGARRLVFVLGGAYGFTDEFRKKHARWLALSALTLPHELARVLVAEQLYRAHSILRGEKYHH